MDPEQLKKLQAQFDEISNGLASGKPDQVKAAQTKLQALGFPVTPDGQLGDETSAAIGALRKTISDAQSNIATTADAKAREAANDPTNRLVKVGTEAAPYLAGGAIGYGISRKMSGDTTAADAELKKSVSRMSRNPDIRPDVAREELGRLKRNRLLRTVKGTAVPGAFFAGAEATRELIAPQFEDPTTRDIVNSFATGEQAAGITTGVKQLVDLRKGSPIDPEDEAVIKSRARDITRPLQQPQQSRPLQTVPPTQLPAPQQSAPPPATPSEPMRHSERLKQTVAAAGGKPGKTKSANVTAIKRGLNAENMPAVAESLSLPREASRPQILQRLREISRIGGKMVLPFAAGALAYDAATSDAQAGTGDETGSDVARGAVAGGTAAGLVAGGNRLLQAIPAAARTAMGAGATMAMPNEIVNAMDGTPDQMNMARNKAARYLPEAVQFGAVNEAREMAQVPERNPMSRPIDPSPQIPAETYEQEAAPPNFDQYLADLQAIFAEMEQGQRQPAPRPMPAPPPAYGWQKNRLLQPTGY